MAGIIDTGQAMRNAAMAGMDSVANQDQSLLLANQQYKNQYQAAKGQAVGQVLGGLGSAATAGLVSSGGLGDALYGVGQATGLMAAPMATSTVLAPSAATGGAMSGGAAAGSTGAGIAGGDAALTGAGAATGGAAPEAAATAAAEGGADAAAAVGGGAAADGAGAGILSSLLALL